nr:acyl-CoA dehydrogenase family protein [Polynucleobacter sp. IMCC 29146]
MFGKTLERYQGENDYLNNVYSQIKIGGAIGSVAYTETGGNTNPKSLKTHLSKIADGSFILYGHKTWITLGGIADFFLVTCLYEGELAIAVVPSLAKGIKIDLIDSLAGNRGSALADITFDKVILDKNQILPTICSESSWPAFEWIFSVGRVYAASSAIGLTKSCISMCFDRLNSRHSLGKKFIENQIWQQELAKANSQLRAVEAIRNVALDYLGNNKYVFLNSDCTIAKNLGAEIAIQSSQLNLKAHGAFGYLENEEPNRLLREALSFEFIEGSSLVLNKKIFSQLVGNLIVNKGNK